jgi:hypothetical protein
MKIKLSFIMGVNPHHLVFATGAENKPFWNG